MTVTAAAGTVTRAVNANYSESFTVRNNGSVSNTYNLGCGTTGSLSSCGGIPASVTLNAGASANYAVSYHANTNTTGTLSLTATGTVSPVVAQTGNTLVKLMGVSVTPDNQAVTRTANAAYSETFTITNIGSESNTFTFVCSRTGSVTCGANPSAVTLAGNGASTTRSQPDSVGQSASGTLTLTATGTASPLVTDPGSFSVSVVGVSVTPDGQTVPARTVGTNGHKETFTIQNLASSSQTYTVNCGGDTKVSCTGTEKTSVTLAPGASTTSWASFNAVAAGTATLTLTAFNGTASNPGTYSVPVDGASAIAALDGASAFAFAGQSNKLRFLEPVS